MSREPLSEIPFFRILGWLWLAGTVHYSVKGSSLLGGDMKQTPRANQNPSEDLQRGLPRLDMVRWATERLPGLLPQVVSLRPGVTLDRRHRYCHP